VEKKMNNVDLYTYVIVALLPLSACLTVLQVNPYHALVIRGILGAIAAMVYSILGAADVALTEALVGTLLAITLYAVAVRSSLVVRLGVLAETVENTDLVVLTHELRTILSKRQMRLELVSYSDDRTLQKALMDKEIHATCYRQSHLEGEKQSYQTTTRIQRLYEIFASELAPSVTIPNYINTSEEKKA
jgi:putative multicomponent Na+:H+ antiporter subunit B